MDHKEYWSLIAATGPVLALAYAFVYASYAKGTAAEILQDQGGDSARAESVESKGREKLVSVNMWLFFMTVLPTILAMLVLGGADCVDHVLVRLLAGTLEIFAFLRLVNEMKDEGLGVIGAASDKRKRSFSSGASRGGTQV